MALSPISSYYSPASLLRALVADLMANVAGFAIDPSTSFGSVHYYAKATRDAMLAVGYTVPTDEQRRGYASPWAFITALVTAYIAGSTPVTLSAVKTSLNLTAAMAPVAVSPFSMLAINQSYTQLQADTSKTFQTFGGVGAAMTASSAYQLMVNASAATRAAILQEYFGAVGVDTVRISIGDCDYNPDYSSGSFISCDDVDAASTYATLPNFALRTVDTQYVIPVLQQIIAINPNIKIIATPWSPPVVAKTTSSLNTGSYNPSTANSLFVGYYIAKFCGLMSAIGLPIYAVAVQNEPDVTAPQTYTYPTCGMTGADLVSIIPNLRAALNVSSPTTKIWPGETTSWASGGRVAAVMANSTTLAQVDGAAYHAYAGDPATAAAEMAAYPTKTINMTEFTGTGIGGMQVASALQGAFYAGNVNTATLWNFALDPSGQPGPPDTLGSLVRVATDGSNAVTRTIQYYASFHIGKFVQLGAKRISTTSVQYGLGSSNPTDVVTLGFLNPDGTVVVIAINAASVAKTVQIEDVQGGGVSTTISLNVNDMATVVFKNPAVVALPDAPTIAMSVGNNSFTLALNQAFPPSGNGAVVTGYDIYTGAAAAETLLASNQALPYTGVGVNGTVEYAYAKTRTSFGVSAASNEVYGTPVAPTGATLVQAPATGVGTSAVHPPVVAFANAVAASSTIVIVFSGDGDLTGPTGSTQVTDTYDGGATSGYIKTWTMPASALSDGKTLTFGTNVTPFGWQIAAYEVANFTSLTETTHATMPVSGAKGYFQLGTAIASGFRVCAASWNGGGYGTTTANITNISTYVASDVMVDASGQGGLSGSAYYHGGTIFRYSNITTSASYANIVSAAGAFTNPAYGIFKIA